MERINRYEIENEIAVGGMSSVFLAFDPNFKRNVVVKLMAPVAGFKADFIARFRREAETVAALEHPAIVPVYDFGEENGLAYIVMKHLVGGDLSKRLAAGPLSLEETYKIMQRICGALAVAHRGGVIHRDLKPGNILFDHGGNAYLADFGLARLQNQSNPPLTVDQQSIGTPGYMSPEQIQGEEISTVSDIYGLGVLVYEMLIGTPPFKGESAAMTLVKQMSAPIPLPSAQRADLPPEIDNLIKRSLAKNPDERPQTPQAFSELLQQANEIARNGGTAVETKDTLPDTDRSKSKIGRLSSRFVLWSAITSMTLMLFAILALQSESSNSAQPTPDQAVAIASVTEERAEIASSTDVAPPEEGTEESQQIETSAETVDITEQVDAGGQSTTTPMLTETPLPIFEIETPPFELPTPENLLENGRFDTAIEPWQLIEQNDGSQDTIESEGELCSRTVNIGENLWDLLIVQQGLTLKQNTLYTLILDVRATPGRMIGIKIGSGTDPYPSYLYEEKFLRDGPQRIVMSFTQPEDDSAANVEFHIGATGTGTLCFDNISLTADLAIP